MSGGSHTWQASFLALLPADSSVSFSHFAVQMSFVNKLVCALFGQVFLMKSWAAAIMCLATSGMKQPSTRAKRCGKRSCNAPTRQRLNTRFVSMPTSIERSKRMPAIAPRFVSSLEGMTLSRICHNFIFLSLCHFS